VSFVVTRSLRSLRSDELMVSPSATLKVADQQAGSAPVVWGLRPQTPSGCAGLNTTSPTGPVVDTVEED